MNRSRKWALAMLPGLAAASVAIAQSSFDFMPDGGTQTLERLVASGALRTGDVAGRKASEQEWQTILRGADPSLDDKGVRTLASYLAINMPMQAPAAAADWPADGKQLAIANCQFCHSFFTGYLVHDRDTEGWRAIFKSPFHMELPMTPAERETFSRYSAINMPIPYDDVPEDLRF